ncbi:tetratricopeptide repeat protein [Flagellatimonas centrodinii]|uniref:tetratricopeptide repeat protein n=1 Tax=Flagellatimonas centrodinii TaxID=2806210 RepID=UPI001FEEFEB1|nr:tetratricopeptide repeat protein [Flagellatimonas centrodinii]ULQ47610.1 tetratricopeptide repeat protein [Flagellatimonas centrodinii]
MTPWTKGLLGAVALMISACASTGGPAPTSVQRIPPPPASPAAGDDVQQRFASALALMDQRQFDDAEAAFLSLCRETPVRSGPCTNLGILMARAGRHEAAADALTRAVEARPDNAEALNLLGVMNRRLGRMDAAEQAYRQALRHRPGYAAAHLNLALLYDDDLHQPVAALAHYRAWQQHREDRDDPLPVIAWIRALEDAQRQAGIAVAHGSAR